MKIETETKLIPRPFIATITVNDIEFRAIVAALREIAPSRVTLKSGIDCGWQSKYKSTEHALYWDTDILDPLKQILKENGYSCG